MGGYCPRPVLRFLMGFVEGVYPSYVGTRMENIFSNIKKVDIKRILAQMI
jgi:hypothetical protein